MQGNLTGIPANGYRTSAGNDNPNPLLYGSGNQELEDAVDEANEVNLRQNP